MVMTRKRQADVMITPGGVLLVGEFNIAPRAEIGFSKLYPRQTGKWYYMDGAGVEHTFLQYYGTSNIFLGEDCGESNLTGTQNVAVGHYAFRDFLGGLRNVVLGHQAALTTLAVSNSVIIGYGAASLGLASGDNNVIIGSLSGREFTTAHSNVVMGSNAMLNCTTANQSVVIGYQAADIGNVTGDDNIIVGYRAGRNITTGNENIILGSNALLNCNIGAANVAIGVNANVNGVSADQSIFIGRNVVGGTGNNWTWNIFMGENAGFNTETGLDNIIIGHDAAYNGFHTTRSIIMGIEAFYGDGDPITDITDCVAIGYGAMRNIVTGSESIGIGHDALRGTAFVGSSTLWDIAIGQEALRNVTGTSLNVAIGAYAAGALETGQYNVVAGVGAMGGNVTGSSNTCIGDEAGSNWGSHERSVMVGMQSGNRITVNDGIFIGFQSGFLWSTAARALVIGTEAGGNAIGTGADNILMGYRAGYVITSGATNVIIGNQAGLQVTTGAGNVILGNAAASASGNLSNTLWIANDNTATPLVSGDFTYRTLNINDRLNQAASFFYDEMFNGADDAWATRTTTGSVAAVAGLNGLVRLTTGAVITNEESLDFNDIVCYANTIRPTFEIRVQLEQIALVEFECGLVEAGGAPDDYIRFLFDASAANTWSAEASTGGAVTADVGDVATTNMTILKFWFNSDTEVEWSINGVSQGTIAVNVPVVNLQPYIAVRTEENVAHYADVDYVKIWADRV